EKLRGARRRVHLDELDLAEIDVVDARERADHVAERLTHRDREPLALDVLWALQRRVGESNDSHRRAGLIERDDLDRQALAPPPRGGARRPIAEVFVAGRDRLEHVLRAVAFGQLHVETFGIVIALLQSDIERRILALELPSETNGQFFRALPAG